LLQEKLLEFNYVLICEFLAFRYYLKGSAIDNIFEARYAELLKTYKGQVVLASLRSSDMSSNQFLQAHTVVITDSLFFLN
jgi:hypothetical protein